MRSLRTPAPLNAVAAVILFTGCASPPSVVPLMRVAQRAMQAEAELLAGDTQRIEQWHAQTRRALRDGFEADLDDQAAIDRQWLAEHLAVYLAADEAVLRQQMKSEQQLLIRIENLHHAAAAQARAVELLQRQDELLERIPDARRWLTLPTTEPRP